jgi:hypothetical protein
MKCVNHDDRDAMSTCRNCKQPFCSECLVEGQEYYYCAQPDCQNAMNELHDELIVPDAAPPPAKLVTIARYSWPYEAELAKSHLEAAGIMAFVTDEYMVNLNWFYSNAMGGLRLQVAEQDVEAAKEILAQDLSSESDDASGSGYT